MSRVVLDLDEWEEDAPWCIGLTGPYEDYTAIYRLNKALGLGLARTEKEWFIEHDGQKTGHIHYAGADFDHGCTWHVLVNAPEGGEVLSPARASTLSPSLFDAEAVAMSFLPVVKKPSVDLLLFVTPAPLEKTTRLWIQKLSSVGKPVPLDWSKLKKLRLEFEHLHTS